MLVAWGYVHVAMLIVGRESKQGNQASNGLVGKNGMKDARTVKDGEKDHMTRSMR